MWHKRFSSKVQMFQFWLPFRLLKLLEKSSIRQWPSNLRTSTKRKMEPSTSNAEFWPSIVYFQGCIKNTFLLILYSLEPLVKNIVSWSENFSEWTVIKNENVTFRVRNFIRIVIRMLETPVLIKIHIRLLFTISNVLSIVHKTSKQLNYQYQEAYSFPP